MSRHSTSSMTETTAKNMLWGSELTQEKQTCTFRAQGERKDSCKLLLSTICLGEKAKEEVNRVEILPQEDRKSPITVATLKASVLPMVTVTGIELSPPVTFRLRAGSGPVFLSGQECYETSDMAWEDDEEEEEEEEEDEDEDEDADLSLEEIPIKQVKRAAPQRPTSIAKRKKVDKEEEAAVRPSPQDKSPWKKGKSTPKPKRSTSKK
ncbi:nucleophosmin/nucleoplasmin 2 [Rattus norvegicus]|uniref:Nucleoplasmin-2 n=2 Tax=Rattus norvegicus TaxID=10116 RepID=A6HTM5_RAT|nr:nucleoplasmin-2 [Rattus norvegicus]EDM02238.1 nucleophosmin/nucleoplasmin 2 [Rattus norvegicus]DAA01383.1 TPA_exp: nucleoplasmin 2 [Rattus norvegicus]|eukprot:NP_976085.1 nucleoplasmin-2 [Rattus norvegicus]